MMFGMAWLALAEAVPKALPELELSRLHTNEATGVGLRSGEGSDVRARHASARPRPSSTVPNVVQPRGCCDNPETRSSPVTLQP
jgi:hypothetical protein